MDRFARTGEFYSKASTNASHHDAIAPYGLVATRFVNEGAMKEQAFWIHRVDDDPKSIS